jgi:nicotinate phosphoribosyltransferase
MSPRRRKRLDPAVFRIPTELVRSGDSAERHAQLSSGVLPGLLGQRVLLQVTAKHDGWLSGIDEAIAMLKGGVDDWTALAVHALYEGDEFGAWDTVLTLEGDFGAFAHLETLILGVLSHRTRVCTNVREIVEAARPKTVVFLGARDEHYLMQPGDGFAAFVGGAKEVSTQAQASLFGGKVLGALPHTFIASLGGNTVAATRKVAKLLPEDVPLLALVDYDNDSVKTSVELARALGERLWGVRLDTSEHMVDRSVLPQLGTFRPTGVNPQLVWNVRNALDSEGFGDVRIVVSGGFDVERIQAFELEGVPVDAYGIGSAAYKGTFDFTADVVSVGGKPQSRAGRKLRENPKLERVK